MKKIGTVTEIWRYPVKSMKGEAVPRAYLSFSGVYGDRAFALVSPGRPRKFPFLTARYKGQLLKYRPVFRKPERTLAPYNILKRGQFDQSASPVFGDLDDFAIDLETPKGKIVDPFAGSLTTELEYLSGYKGQLNVLYSQRALTDCRPISMVSIQAARELLQKSETAVDLRRFRPNIMMDLVGLRSGSEIDLVGSRLQLGEGVVLYILEPDARCKVIDLNPETGVADCDLLTRIAMERGGVLGVYAAVLVEGIVSVDDPIHLL